MSPKVSVIIRSFRRPKSVVGLIRQLCEQDHDSFEIVVIEQSCDTSLEAALSAVCPEKVRVFGTPPLGAPGARNEGVRRSRGEILVFIDDDDLPVGNNFLSAHVANYADPRCLGVNGRLTSSPKSAPPSMRFSRLVRWASFRHTMFKDPRTLAFGGLRKKGIDFLIGSNSSLRRSAISRAGGWDEGVPMGEEQSFAFRLARVRKADEYLVYDPVPLLYRRVDIAGGLDRRSQSDWATKDMVGRIIYYHSVVGHYFPRRFRIFYPVFVLRLLQQVVFWVWDADNVRRSPLEKLLSLGKALLLFPALEWRMGWRLPVDTIKRITEL